MIRLKVHWSTFFNYRYNPWTLSVGGLYHYNSIQLLLKTQWSLIIKPQNINDILSIRFLLDGLAQGGLLLAMLLCFELSAQEQIIAKSVTGKYTVDPPYVQKISQLNGVNLGFVRKTIRGYDGFMWMITEAGLVRYDGYDAKVFPVSEGTAKNYLMLDVVEDSSHFLWITTAYHGLLKFDPVTEKYQKYLQLVDESTSTGLIALSYLSMKDKDTLLVGSDKELIQFDVNTHHHQTIKRGGLRPSTYIMESLVDDAGNMWIATVGKGVFVQDATTGQQHQFAFRENKANALSSDRAYRIIQDSEGTIWVGTRNGINSINSKTRLVTKYRDDNPQIDSVLTDMITAIAMDEQGNIWIASMTNGLVKYDAIEQRFSKIDIALDITFNIFSDNNQVLWLSTSEGLYKLDLPSLAFTTLSNGPKSRTTAVDEQGDLWLGSKGLAKFDEQTLGFTHFPQLDDMYTFAMGKGSLLYSHYTDGNFLSWLDINSFAFRRIYIDLTATLGPIGASIHQISFYGDDLLYLVIEQSAGRDFGLFRHDVKNGKSFLLHKVSRPVKMLVLPEVDKVLIASMDRLQLYDFEQESVKNIEFNPSWEVEIRCLYEDPGSLRIWICLEGQGLALYDRHNHTIEMYKWTDGLIKSVVADIQGDIWLGTSKGVVKLNVKTKIFNTYKEFNDNSGLTFVLGAGARLPSGAVVLGANAKTLYFKPKDIIQTNTPFETKITELKVLNKVQKIQPLVPTSILTQSISHSESIILTHEDYLFSLSFASLGYREPEHQQYAYKLEGLDTDWIYTDANNRVATYTTLAAGDYVFRVKGRNNNDEWNQGSSLKITVLAPWWATKIAYGLYAILILSVIALTFYLRTKRLTLRAQNLTKAVEQRTDELQRVLADKDKLIANISHEFRTPLTLMLGPIESELRQSNNDKSKGLLSLAKTNGHRLLSMVDQLLDIARTKDHTNHTLQRINVGETAVFLVESYRSLAQKHRIELTLDNQLAGDVYLNMQPDALEKILSNLLSNAFKYSDDGQNVTLRLIIIDDNQLSISVKDTGEGISEVDQQQIFERFSRVYSNSKYVPGAGIGLALVKELVVKHQGSISVKSEEAVGSEFTVLLPLSDSSAGGESGEINRSLVLAKLDDVSKQQLSEDEAQLGIEIDSNEQKPSILIVEDNQDMRQYMVSCLSPYFQCLTAKDGQMGIEMAQQNQPDLIITDLMMPKKDGFEVTRTLKQNDATNHIPIILLTAHADEQNRATGWQEKVDEFLQKPFNTEQLINRINNLLSVRLLLSQRYQRALTSPASDLTVQLSKPDLNQADNNAIHQTFYESMNAVFEANYANESFGVTEFSQQMNSSPRNMARKMKTMLGIKPNEALRIFRLKKAAEMLSQGELAGNVAIAVGFASHSYFAQCFKAQYGCMPSNYGN